MRPTCRERYRSGDLAPGFSCSSTSTRRQIIGLMSIRRTFSCRIAALFASQGSVVLSGLAGSGSAPERPAYPPLVGHATGITPQFFLLPGAPPATTAGRSGNAGRDTTPAAGSRPGMRCFKAFGERITARDPDCQTAEIHVRIALMNRFNALEPPRSPAWRSPPQKGPACPKPGFCNNAVSPPYRLASVNDSSTIDITATAGSARSLAKTSTPHQPRAPKCRTATCRSRWRRPE